MNDRYDVVYSPEALEDLRNIYSYIAFELQVPDIAKGQIIRIRKKVKSLNFMPFRYALVEWEPWKSMKMYRVPVDNYVIYYLVESNKQLVTVVRIFYSGRDIEGVINGR
ncbi:MAG: type II toxin-antitoxin system RelE/ParE family toxin [Lachnospiraceae bacterium]|jgi:toxin ParE1/3/4|nr:type II toxin-antitoxin system RelE/ParE family toxin [Lachnospiraceae bacterium]